MKSVHDLLDLLILDEVCEHQYKGFSKTVGSPNVFGGQVLAQALNAASRTIKNNRILHSMHSYFLEAGQLELPIVYDVSIVRDGGSFSVRRVTAQQNGKTIFILSASFHKKEDGYNHQLDMKFDLKQPEELMSWTDYSLKFGSVLPKIVKDYFEIERPVDFKPTNMVNPLNRKDLLPFNDVWFKLKGDIPELNLSTKQQILTYISDYNILACTFNPHASKAHWGNTRTASLDHSMWYFRDFDFKDWMLYSIETPNASNARGFANGHIFSRDGKLIASVAQEGLLRPIIPKQ